MNFSSRSARFTLSLILSTVAGFALIACGDSGDSSGTTSTSTEDASEEITTVLNSFFTTSDPKQCTDEVTSSELRESLPKSVPAKQLVSECKKSLDPSAEAKSIEVSNVKVDGSDATAEVTANGGTYAGTVATFALVDDGGWKIDDLNDLKITSRKEYLRTLADGAAEAFGDDALPKKDAACIAGYISKNVSTPELERSAEDNNRDFAYEAINFCVGGGVDLVTITFLVKNQLQEAGLPKRQADCVAGLGIRALGDVTLKDFAEKPAVKTKYEKALKQSAPSCG